MASAQRTHTEPFFDVNNGQVRVRCADAIARGPDGGCYVTQEANMIRNFTNQVRSEKLNEDWPDIALKTQLVMDACLGAARTGRVVGL